ncbi:MAG: hypothetical protein K8S87_10300 [Planctomycetes bacterium]|nr:hypothetical protein [Planctomycetota bacterium]
MKQILQDISDILEIREDIINKTPSGGIRAVFNRLLYYFEYSILFTIKEELGFSSRKIEKGMLHGTVASILLYLSNKMPNEFKVLKTRHETLTSWRSNADYWWRDRDFTKFRPALEDEIHFTAETLVEFEKLCNTDPKRNKILNILQSKRHELS